VTGGLYMEMIFSLTFRSDCQNDLIASPKNVLHALKGVQIMLQNKLWLTPFFDIVDDCWVVVGLVTMFTAYE